MPENGKAGKGGGGHTVKAVAILIPFGLPQKDFAKSNNHETYEVKKLKHFTKYHQPEFSIKDFLLPFCAQYLILLACMMLHRLVVDKGSLLCASAMVGDEMSSPTVGRLIYCLIAFLAAVGLTALASRKAKEGKEYLPFFLGLTAGTFFWQSLGEDSWHFSINDTNFIQFESISVFPVFVLTCLFVVYAVRNSVLNWGVWCALLGFLCNWWGHYIMLGTYPFVAAYFEESVWNKGVAQIAGGILLAIGIYLELFSAKDRKGRLLASILTYISTGIIIFGTMEG